MKHVIILMALLISMFFNGLLIAKIENQKDFVITHEEAFEMCEALGLTYDFESEGNTIADFCKPYWESDDEHIQ